ncbi:MAG: endonuclease V [Phycisphaerae bacterium]
MATAVRVVHNIARQLADANSRRQGIRMLHAWPSTPKEAVALQSRLAARVVLTPVRSTPRLIAGLDAAFTSDDKHVIAGVVVWDAQRTAVVEQQSARRACTFPYVPGLLSFRETPALLDAIRALRTTPEVFLCDAQGLAHPRRFGLACHLGLWLNRPTIGCAKTRLCGEFEPPGLRRGDRADLTLHGGRVGTVLRTRTRVRPIFVSPGHLCDFEAAEAVALACASRFRLPEPTRLAHLYVTKLRASTR